MIQVVLIDDEVSARFLMRSLLERHFSSKIDIVGEAANVNEGISTIEKCSPDLVFLDIKLANGTGFDILNGLTARNFKVIFVTAYDSYAIKAFDFSAIGYLLKPFKLMKLKNCIDRFEKERTNDDQKDQLKALLNNVQNLYDSKPMNKIVLGSMKGFDVVDIDNIIRLESYNNYTNFILTDGTKTIASKTIGQYEKLLNDKKFFRIHQSHIINLKHVKSYFKDDGGQVLMTDNSMLSISRNKRPYFIQIFK